MLRTPTVDARSLMPRDSRLAREEAAHLRRRSAGRSAPDRTESAKQSSAT